MSKSKEDVTIACTKEGFQDAIASIPSGFEGWTIGNIVIGGVIGLGIDASTGAINDYPNAFQVPMLPLPGAAVVAAAPPPTAVPAAVAQVMPPAVRPSLGIIGTNVTRNSSGPATNLADPYGTFVNGVAPRSPAAEAGIQQGDIIRSFNGERVSTFEELDAMAVQSPPGRRVILGVYRNRQIVDVELGL